MAGSSSESGLSRLNPKHLLHRDGGSASAQAAPAQVVPKPDEAVLDIQRRRADLYNQVAGLQWDLGGLVYEMATRNSIHVDVLVARAAELQQADSELQEIDRILQLEQTSTAGLCERCGAPHSSGAAFCWQCGAPILRQVDTSEIFSEPS
jgi:ribosomal protein L40E